MFRLRFARNGVFISNDEMKSFYLLSGGLSSWESDDDDVDDEDSMVTALGCLGPLGGLLAPELQRYHKHLKGRCSPTVQEPNPKGPPITNLSPPDKSLTSSSTSSSSKGRDLV